MSEVPIGFVEGIVWVPLKAWRSSVVVAASRWWAADGDFPARGFHVRLGESKDNDKDSEDPRSAEY